MAALKEIAREYADEIRDGIGWLIVYRTGRSWHALTVWSDLSNNEWETDDINDASRPCASTPGPCPERLLPRRFGDMTIDDIAAGIRWHYERGTNALAADDALTQARADIEAARQQAAEAGLPFSERLVEGPEDEPNLYAYDGSMTVADYEAAHRARDAHAALVEVVSDRYPNATEEAVERVAEAASSMKLSPEAVQRILNAFDRITEASRPSASGPLRPSGRSRTSLPRRSTTSCCDEPRPSGATMPSTRSGPASARNTATASGGPSSLRWLRKEVGAREVQVRRLRALLECEHIPADPPRRLHLPAL